MKLQHRVVPCLHSNISTMTDASQSSEDPLEKKKGERDGDGGAPFGNFHNYYTFNPVSQRLDAIAVSASLVRFLKENSQSVSDSLCFP